jgi:hypothetical protein
MARWRGRPSGGEVIIIAVIVALVIVVGWYVLQRAHWNAG